MVSIRAAQEAAIYLGPVRTDEIVGPGGLSGASAEALAQLVNEAALLRKEMGDE